MVKQEQAPMRRPSFLGDRSSEADILKMLDKIEELVEGSLHLFNKAWFVDIEEFFVLTNRIRASLPDEVKRASRVATDSDKIVSGAREEAMQIVEQAQEQADNLLAVAKEEAARLVDSSEVNRLATSHAREIVAASEETAREIRAGADAYAKEVLTNLENFTARIVGTIQRGREKLDTRAATPAVEELLGPPQAGRNERGARR